MTYAASDKTVEMDDSFVAAAVLHSMITVSQAEEIADYARSNGLQQSDAALRLTTLSPQQVDAVRVLNDPENLVPGYSVTSLAGCGSAGTVFRARQTALDREVAIKAISLAGSAAEGSRTHLEARAIARLQHPNIVAAFDSGVHDGRFYIVMELIDGEDLAQLIRRMKRLPERLAWQIVRQVAAGLAHAEKAKVFHRDIKPGNILLTTAGAENSESLGGPVAKVADFGLAYCAATPDDTQLTKSGTMLGTPAYVAPEQLRDTHVDGRADIYSLGATMFHMLTGSPPYHDLSPLRAVLARTSGDDSWRETLPPDLRPETAQLLLAMTESDPEQRVSGYAELLSRIDALLTGTVVETVVDSAPRKRTARPSWRSVFNRRLGVAGLLVTALFICLGVFASRRETAPRRADTMVPRGLPVPLFNGLSVPLFPKSGSWQPLTASDGSRVLAAKSNSQMTIPLMSSFTRPVASWRFRASLQPQGNAWGLIELPGRDVSHAILVGRGEARLVPSSPAGSLHDAAAKHRRPLRPAEGEVGVLQEVQISYSAGSVTVHINGQALGDLGMWMEESPTVVLRALEGEVHFADMDVVELTAADQL